MLTFNKSIDGGTFEEATPHPILVANMVIGQRYFLDSCFDLSGILEAKNPSMSFGIIKGDVGAYHLENGTIDFPQYAILYFYTYIDAN